MPFFEWLRKNSERYLIEAAQEDMARRYLGRQGPLRDKGLLPLFWERVFVPVFRLIPWELRRKIMQAMPGSHRRGWKGRSPP
jgi:hypothetical protein